MPKKKSRKPVAPKLACSDSDSEYDDEIQTYHKQKDKIFLDDDHNDASDDTEEEEVFGLDMDDSDEEIENLQQQLRQIKRNKVKKKLDSDLEADSEEEDLPDSRAWGSKQSWFIGGDVRDNKIILSGEEDEAGAAVLEEKEMQEIEKRQLARMSEEDYLHPLLMKRTKKKERKKAVEKTSDDSDSEKEGDQLAKTKGKKKKKKKEPTEKSSVENGMDELERIQVETDFSKLPKEAEFERLKELHPEYEPLVNDFGQKMKEMQERIIPMMGLVKQGKLQGLGATYVQMKYHIINNYLICGGFYMYFMAKRTAHIHRHPVMKRLLELQQFYNRLVSVDKSMKGDVDRLLEHMKQGKKVDRVVCNVDTTDDATTSSILKKKARKATDAGDRAVKKRKMEVRQEAGLLEEDDDNEEQPNMDYDGEDDNDDDPERRAITYQMEKNKGLTAHKKKELKNPRVKHRTKYKRALVRRKGQVQDFKRHKTAYSGEMTGIRAGIIRSRKLK